MPHIVIDGQRIEASTGKTIIQAAYDNGMQVPHYCWHPELSVAGNCRMCLVEIGMPKRNPDGSFDYDSDGKQVVNYFPKLQIACATQISDGMHVLTGSAKAVKAQEAVMEFLLINHPLDCPICDEAGQCKLQEYAFTHSKGESRFVEEKNHAPKRVQWGPNVIFDGERCIQCSRCIRFSEEIAHQKVLSFVDRSDHVTIKVANGKQLDNDYSMNVIDICPVGALTSADFRFKSRVWDMSFNDSICPGCSFGCNIKIGVRNNQILRLEPRSNMNVNKYWMCDWGRLTQYKFVNENRILNPIVDKLNGCAAPTEVSWQEALEVAAANLSKLKPSDIMLIGSGKASNEDNYILQKFSKKVIRTQNIDFVRYYNESFEDGFLKKKDKTPNSTGATRVGVAPGPGGYNTGNLVERIRFRHIKALYIMEDDLSGIPEIYENLGNLNILIVHSSNRNALTELANIVFPAATYTEIEGSYVNYANRVQHFTPAVATAENLRFMGMKMGRLDKFGSINDRWTQHEMNHCMQSWRVIQELARMLGANWKYNNSSSVFDEIAQQIAAFKGMSYELLDEFQGLVLGGQQLPKQTIFKYKSHVFKPN